MQYTANNQPIKPQINPYYTDEQNYCLLHCDNLEFFKNRESQSIDCIFTDPPYFLTDRRDSPSYKGDWDLSGGFAKDFAFHQAWIKEALRVLKPDGVIWITGTDHNIHQCGVALQMNGAKIVNNITWYKPRAKWANTTTSLAFSHEVVLFAKKTDKARPYLNQAFLNTPQDKFHTQGQSMPTIWDIKPARLSEVKGHTTPKPVELMKRALLLSTKSGAVILDCFNGSGSTGVAVMELGGGRKYIGIDQNRDYLELSITRIEEAKKRLKNNLGGHLGNLTLKVKPELVKTNPSVLTKILNIIKPN